MEGLGEKKKKRKKKQKVGLVQLVDFRSFILKRNYRKVLSIKQK